MKKILIPILGLLVLPLAMPSSATFYNEDEGETEQRASSQERLADFDHYRWSAQKQRLKKGQKISRNSAYGSRRGGSRSDQKGGSLGGSKAGGSKAGGSKGKPASYNKGSKGGSKGSKGSADSGKHGKPVQYKPDHWDISRFKHLDKDFWSKDDFDQAMLCWLAPHLNEDKKFVNRHWNKWGYKWKWLHKYYKHKYHKQQPDKPSEVPVPAAFVLFGSALLGMAAFRKRQRH